MNIIHILDIEEHADIDSFNKLMFAENDEDRDAAIAGGWTLCQTEAIATNGGLAALHTLGRNE